jgi:hypothetical protein
MYSIDFKRHLLSAGAIGAVGFLTGLAMNGLHDQPGNGQFLPADGDIIPVIAFVGAAVSGFACASAFGRPGRYGIIWAVAGAILATTIGAAVAGATMVGFMGAALGVIGVVDYFVRFPSLVLAWAAMMLAVHWGLRVWAIYQIAPDLFDE